MEIKAKRDIKQFLKFALIGVMNTLIDMGVYMLLVALLNMNYVLAQIIAYTCGILNSYLFNTLWTFKEERKRNVKEFVLFVAVNAVALGVSIGLLALCTGWIFVDGNIFTDFIQNALGSTQPKAIELFSKIPVTPVIMVINFILNKKIVFKEKAKQD